MSNNNSSSGGIGFLGMLAIVFIVLKLCKVIDWSWWWITCPLWGPLALVITGGLIYLPFWLYKKRDTKNRLSAGYNQYGWNKGGKSKWQQRLDDMQKSKQPK
jgi:hypothetical protein